MRATQRSSLRCETQRRGVVLVFVLVAVLMAATLASTFLGGQSTSIGIARNVDNQARARFVAESGLELAIAHVRSNSSWRTDHSQGSWVTDDPFAGGTFTVVGEDGADADGDGVIANPAEGDGDLADDTLDLLTLTVTGKYGGASHSVRAVVTPIGGSAAFEVDTITAGPSAQAVTFSRLYNSPVVVCTVNYYNNKVPIVPRVNNVTSTGFEVYLQNPKGAKVLNEIISYIVMEEGAWEFNGVKCEAHKYVSTVTDQDNSWKGEQQEYSNTYVKPVVIGQVMSAIDSDWSVFWCYGTKRANPPSAAKLWTGKTVCEDKDTTREDEIVGYIVFEAGHRALGGVASEAGLGKDILRGVQGKPPYVYTFSTAFGTVPKVALTTLAGIDGGNGGWAVLYGKSFVLANLLRLAIDEDQIKDKERAHTTEQVGYLVFEKPVVCGTLSGGGSGGYNVSWR